LVSTAPELLVVVLLRFGMENGKVKKKENRVVKVVEDVAVSGEKYKLKAVVVHKGSHLSGHYTAITNVGGKWFRCDDAKVNEIGAAQLLMEGSGGYILFYEKRLKYTSIPTPPAGGARHVMYELRNRGRNSTWFLLMMSRGYWKKLKRKKENKKKGKRE